MAEVARRLVQKVVTGSLKLALVATNYSKPRLATFWKYAWVELNPPTPGEIPMVVESFNGLVASFKAGNYKQVTVKDAPRNTHVATEIVMWFYISEVIGRRSLIGYNV
ncbi:ATP synthase subunit g, mitochondrial-like [Carcharodon carcharias]|uniref:ATP synthase subunit g, mitochondrial-like n=1 Tax=Carcharodon carcharias TaxID=13397 RepID=UPI001B7F6DC8|nr:ATP synthase subunit g, mitochondrial-like [Carcharodon carcharias]